MSFSPNSTYKSSIENDIEEEVERQLPLIPVDKVDGLIQFNVNAKVGPLDINIPIKTSEFRFSGKVRVKLELMNNFSHIKMAYISLLEHPDIDFSLKPIDHLLGLDITQIPGFKSLLNRQVHLILDPMMLAPSVYALDIEKMMGSSGEIDSAIGVLKLTVVSAMGLKNVELLGVIDPFVSVNIENRSELGHTKTVKNTTAPVWDDTFTILVYNLNETLNLVIKDQNDVKKNSTLGTTSFDLRSLMEEPSQDNCGKVIRNGKQRGDLTYRVTYYPVAEALKLEDGSEQQVTSGKYLKFIIF